MSRIDELQPGYDGPVTPNVGRDNLAALLSRLFGGGGGGQGEFPAAPTFSPFSNTVDPVATGAIPTPTPSPGAPQAMPDAAGAPIPSPRPVNYLSQYPPAPSGVPVPAPRPVNYASNYPPR